MALTSYKEWRQRMAEASPMTRLRNLVGVGYPMTAGIMSRSTPSPTVMKKAIDELGTPEHPMHGHRPKKGKKKHGGKKK